MKIKLSIIIISFIIAVSLPAKELKFIIDTAQSNVGVDVTATPKHKFTCNLDNYVADIRLNKKSKKIKFVNFKFNLADVNSGIKSRDKKMRSWIEHDNLPMAEFELISINESNGKSIAVGKYKMHNVVRKIEMPFDYKIDGEKISIKGSVILNTTDYNLPIIKLLFFKVNPNINVHFELNGKLRAAK